MLHTHRYSHWLFAWCWRTQKIQRFSSNNHTWPIHEWINVLEPKWKTVMFIYWTSIYFIHHMEQVFLENAKNGVFIFTYISVVQETVASTNRFPHHLDYFRSINNLFSLVRLHKQKTVGHYQACKTQDFWQIWIRNCRYFSYVIWYSLTLQVFHPDTCFFLNNLTDQGKVLNDWLEPTLGFVLRIITKRHNREEILKCQNCDFFASVAIGHC